MTEEQLLEWAERAEVVVALPGTEGAGAAAAAAPGKELPAWFRHEEPTSASVGGGSEEFHSVHGGAGSAAADGEAQRKRLEQQYLQQYLQQVQAAAAAAAGEGPAAPDAKRMKTGGELGEGAEEGAAVKVEVEPKREEPGAAAPPAVAEAAEDDDVEWKDA
jgi:hypothetical protein